MTMTDNEIINEYRLAKAKQKQIGILADLNVCSKREIVDVLARAGEKLPGNFGPRQKPKVEQVPVDKLVPPVAPEQPEPDPEIVTRKDILAAAERCVCGEREQDYGSPEDNFTVIADLWADYLRGCGVKLDFLEPHDVAAMLALLKSARIATGHGKADNWIDLAGYAACGGECEARE